MVFAASQQQPSGGAVNCQALNSNENIRLFNGTFQPNGIVEPTLVAGTAQWAPFVTHFAFKLTLRLDQNRSSFLSHL